MFTFGEKPTFDYEPRDHTNLCSLLNLVDFQQGTNKPLISFVCRLCKYHFIMYLDVMVMNMP
jgi:seryl-tRNA synthetase